MFESRKQALKSPGYHCNPNQRIYVKPNISSSMTPTFQDIVDAYYENLYKFAYSLSRSRDDAWDLTQQTILQWARKNRSIRNPGATKSWLYTTCYREHLKNAKKSSRFTTYEEEAEEPERVSADEIEQVRSAEAQDVMAALMQLKDPYRQVVSLFFLESYTYEEIANILSIPIGTVMSRLSRGKEQLKTAILKSSTAGNIVKFTGKNRRLHG